MTTDPDFHTKCLRAAGSGWLRPNFIAVCLDETEDRAPQLWNLGNVA
jgi:hypothetical protein